MCSTGRELKSIIPSSLTCPFLEFEADVQEAVERVGIVVLGVFGEGVGFVLAAAILVVAVLLVSSGAQVDVVGHVLQL